VHGSPKDELPVKASDAETVTLTVESTSIDYYMRLIICIFGLQVSYITWGVLQVRKLSCVSVCESCMLPLENLLFILVVFLFPGTDYDSIL